MRKIFILLAILIVVLTSCGKKEKPVNENIVKPDFEKEELGEKFGTEDIYIVKTYIESPADEFQSYLDENKIFTMIKHYQLSDGTWKTDSFNYKYKLILTGRLNNAVKDSTYEVLTNNSDITFDMAWKASGLSSNSKDYFKEEDAIIVAVG